MFEFNNWSSELAIWCSGPACPTTCAGDMMLGSWQLGIGVRAQGCSTPLVDLRKHPFPWVVPQCPIQPPHPLSGCISRGMFKGVLCPDLWRVEEDCLHFSCHWCQRGPHKITLFYFEWFPHIPTLASSFDTLSGTLSGRSDIYYSDILSGILSDIYSDILSSILSDICWDILSGILSGIYLIFYLT